MKFLKSGRYYVISEMGVTPFTSYAKAKSEMAVEKSDFVQYGNDYVCVLTEDSLEIVKDIKLIERVASQKIFSKDKMDLSNWINLVIAIIVLFSMSSLGEKVENTQKLLIKDQQQVGVKSVAK